MSAIATLLAQGGAGVLGPLVGTLDAEGRAGAAFTLPPGLVPGLAGLVVHHAYCSLDPSAAFAVVLASNPAAVTLIPFVDIMATS